MTRLGKKTPAIRDLFFLHQFPGARQRQTPIATEDNLRQFVALLPGTTIRDFLAREPHEDWPAKRRRITLDDLYIMRYTTSRRAVKIGRSNNVQRRKKDLEAGQNFFVEVVAVFPGYGVEENTVHRRLKDKRSHAGTGTEWFNVSTDEALDCIRQVILERDSNRSDYVDACEHLDVTIEEARP